MTRRLGHEIALTRALHNAAIYLLAQHAQIDPVTVLRMPMNVSGCKREEWRRAMRMRRAAVYVTLTLFNLPQAHIAASLGISREAVRQMLARVEDDADLDYALQQLAFLNDDADALLFLNERMALERIEA